MKLNNKNIKIFLTIAALSITFATRDQINKFILKPTKNLLLSNAKQILDEESKLRIKKYIFSWQQVDFLRKENESYKSKIDRTNEIIQTQLSQYILANDIELKNNLTPLKYKQSTLKVKLKNSNIELRKYKPNGKTFLRGINNYIPGSGFLDAFEDNLVLLSSTGIIAHAKYNNEALFFNQIKNNLDKFIEIDQFKKNRWFSFKDLLIDEKNIYVSFTNEVTKNCWNTSILYGKFNFKNINFEPLFSPKECVNSKNNIDKVFNAHQSGGRIKSLDSNYLIFSTGEYRQRYLAQKKDSHMGKILKLKKIPNNNKFDILSIGHRNIQGLLFDEKNKYIISTEHGPFGGDEINILKNSDIKKGISNNFGWPIASYGMHYGSVTKGELGWTREGTNPYLKYPLYDSHKKNGFIEPINYYVPSIGISEIVLIDNSEKIYLHTSLKDGSLYLFKINKKDIFESIKRIPINERIRDIFKYEDYLIMFLEDTGSIGIIDIAEILSIK